MAQAMLSLLVGLGTSAQRGHVTDQTVSKGMWATVTLGVDYPYPLVTASKKQTDGPLFAFRGKSWHTAFHSFEVFAS